MHPEVFLEFDRICKHFGAGGDVLEIGAVPEPDTLLCLPSLAGARSKTGVNLLEFGKFRDFEIHQMDANDMSTFAMESFDTVLSNATLEHDRFFWKTLQEIRRVARPNALIVIGVPGYDINPTGWTERLKDRTRRLLEKHFEEVFESLQASTPTLVVHSFPSDYYRFSTQAMLEVILEGLDRVEVRKLLKPPRFIGIGFKG